MQIYRRQPCARLVAEAERLEWCHSMWLVRATCWCAVFLFVSNAAYAMARSQRDDAEAGGAILSFLSGPEKETQQPATEKPPPTPQDDTRNFDGVWTFTSAGCTYTGSLPARIVGGKIIVRGGSGRVDPDGTLHSVGAGNGMTLTAVGQLSGNTVPEPSIGPTDVSVAGLPSSMTRRVDAGRSRAIRPHCCFAGFRRTKVTPISSPFTQASLQRR